MKRTSLVLVLVLFSAAQASALDAGYRLVDFSGEVEVCAPFSGACGPLKAGFRPESGSKLRTGAEASADLSTDERLDNVLRVGADTRITFLETVPLRVALDEGSLFILKEEQFYPDVRILTRDFLAVIRHGGCKLETSGGRVTLKVFSESVDIHPKAGNGYAQVPFTVEEGFRYASEGWERMTYPDYMEWQFWYKKTNERRDRLPGAAR